MGLAAFGIGFGLTIRAGFGFGPTDKRGKALGGAESIEAIYAGDACGF